MTKQTINIGASEEVTGATKIRDAFDMINDNFDELYARCPAVADSLIQVITTNATEITGAKMLYVFNPGGDITAVLAAYASVLYPVVCKNISAHHVDITGTASETFDGHAGGTRLAAGKSIVIYKYNLNYLIAQGEYLAVS